VTGSRRRALLLAHLALLVLALALKAPLFVGRAHVGWDVTSQDSPWSRDVPVWNLLYQDPVTWELPVTLQGRAGGTWNPRLGLGQPAGVTSLPFHGYAPAVLAHQVLPMWLARELLTLAHLVLAGALTLRWLVWRGHGVRAALLGALAWELSTQNSLWLCYSTRVGLAAWTPLALWAAEQAARQLSPASAARLAGAAGLALLGGLIDQAGVLLLAVCALIVLVQAAPGGRGRALLVVAGAMLGAAAIAALRLLPMALEVADSTRVARPLTGWLERTVVLDPRHLLLLVFPDILGSPLRNLDLFRAPGQAYANYLEVRLYVGLPALALALCGVAARSRTRGLAALVLLAAAAAFPTPLAWIPGLLLPGFSSSAPTRALWVAHALLPPLVAAGAGRALRGDARVGTVALALVGLALAVALAVGQPSGAEALLPPTGGPDAAARHEVGRALARILDLTASPTLVEGEGRRGWLLSPTLGPVLLALGTAIALHLVRRAAPGSDARRRAGGLLVGLAALDLLGPALVFLPTSSPAALFAPTPALERARALTGPGLRAVGLSQLPNLLMPLGLRDAGGCHSAPPARPGALYTALGSPALMPQLLEAGRLPRPWLELLAVRVLLTPRGLTPARAEGLTRDPVEDAALSVWVVPGVETRARLFDPRGVLRRRTQADALALARDPAFDPRRHVVLEDPTAPDPAAAPDQTAPPARPLPLALDEDERVVIAFDGAPEGSVVLLADTWARGWRATLEDGATPPAAPADVALRGVELPRGGSGQVTWSYAPPGRPTGRAVTLAALLVAVVAVFASRRPLAQRRRKAAAWPVAIA
jgi:hypothetical protein